jgi:hypothetical protein
VDHSPKAATIPTRMDIERICAWPEARARNLQITQCYHELAAALQLRTGRGANWCTFATWASKQAGQSIRKEDLVRSLEDRLLRAPELNAALTQLAKALQGLGADRSLEQLQRLSVKALDLSSAVERTSQAVGRGNLKVFREIGHEFARFFEVCPSAAHPDTENLARFCSELLPGPPPDGQEYLQHAFTHLHQALYEPSPQRRTELMLLANIEIGYHEQTRLQPEIQAAMDAPLVSGAEFLRRLLSELFPATTAAWLLARTLILRLFNRPPLLELAVQRLLSDAQAYTQSLLTESMLALSLPGRQPLRLGRDLAGEYPSSLRQLTNPDLCALLAKIDPTPDSLAESGALNWASLPDRLHFIIELFRLEHENESLPAPPFTPEQVLVIKSGGLPSGRL